METETIAFSLLLLPLLSALVTLLFFRNSGNIASLLSVATSGGILVFSLFLIFQGENEAFVWQGTWIKLANWELNFGFLIDAPARLLLFVVSFVGFLIHIFSLVIWLMMMQKLGTLGVYHFYVFYDWNHIADNLIMIFVFWELVGFSSYLLIAHYFTTDEAAQASKKAFIVNRVGDFGF